jgi:beta-phosphoglucomutase-like phosphatase (HAD superfamily)
MHFKALLWDMDGSMINSETLYEVSMHQTNSKYGLSMEGVDEVLGVSLPDIWAKISPGLYRAWADEIQAYVVERAHTLSLFESAQHLIHTAYSRQIQQTCVSNNSKHFIEKILTQNKVDHIFHHWIGHEDVEFRKPHPRPYQYSAELLKIDPSLCLAIEDSAVGVASAKAAGIQVALYHPNTDAKPITDQADYVVKCHKELINLLAS